MSFRVTPTHFPGWKVMAASMQTLPKNTGSTRLHLHLTVGVCVRSEQRTKLITLCMALVPGITLAAPKGKWLYHQYHHLWLTSKQTCYYRYYCWDTFLQHLSVGHSWMISLGCPTGNSSQTCQFSVFQAHSNGLRQEEQHLTWNTGSGHNCLCNYLIYSDKRTILYLQMLAKLCYWNDTHTSQLLEYHAQKGLL